MSVSHPPAPESAPPRVSRPWVTYALVAACVGLHLALWPSRDRAEAEVAAASAELRAIREHEPEARISFAAAGLPPHLEVLVQPVFDDRRLGNQALEAVVRRLLDGWGRLPASRFGWRPEAPAPWRAIPSIFVHASLPALLGNMLALLVVGSVLEAAWRRWAFGALFLLSGLSGVLAYQLLAPAGPPLLGASGALAGLLGALLVAYRSDRTSFGGHLAASSVPVFGVRRVAPAVVLSAWIGVQVFWALWLRELGAYPAQLGGFALGAVLGLAARQAGLVTPEFADAAMTARTSAASPSMHPGSFGSGLPRTSVRPPQPSEGLREMVPGLERRSTRPPPAEGLEQIVPGELRRSTRPPPAEVSIRAPGRPSLRPPAVPSLQAPHSGDRVSSPPAPRQGERHSIRLGELPPPNPRDKIER
ncbi:MAG: rhomboid family intramembrane serine protease [Deltaproteobacteria bacterium]|jgi:membrane associated rhomboid family serine protease